MSVLFGKDNCVSCYKWIFTDFVMGRDYSRTIPTQPPTIWSSFWYPRNLSNHMDRQANPCNTVLVKGIEMTGRSQTLPCYCWGRRFEDDRKQNILAPLPPLLSRRPRRMSSLHSLNGQKRLKGMRKLYPLSPESLFPSCVL